MTKYKIVVVGCGGMSNLWLDYAEERPDAEIVGLVDIREESAIAMAERRGLHVPTYTDLKQALEETGANLVFDITIPDSHRQVVTTAIEAGCNIFGEKPMGASMADAKAMLELAQSTGKRYAVMQNRRYLKQIREFRNIIESESIGSIGSVYADFYIGAHFGGFRDAMESPLLLDMAIHTFDQARFITGADPVSVYCHEYNPPGSWYQGNAAALCIFEMSDGSVFCYSGSWCAEGFPTSWEANWRITGSKGTAMWDGASSPVCEIVDEDGPAGFTSTLKPVQVPSTWNGREGHKGCLDEMFASLDEERAAETECTDNIKSMTMVFGALESARTKQRVML